MLRTIFVPLDGSQLAEHALPYAERLAEATSARIVLDRVLPLNIIEPPNKDLALAATARMYLEQLANRLTGRGLVVETVTQWGEPGPMHPRTAALQPGGPGRNGHTWPVGAGPLALRQRRRCRSASVASAGGAGPARRDNWLAIIESAAHCGASRWFGARRSSPRSG